MKSPTRNHDQGSALVMVLIIVVILSLWFSSVAMLTQSANSAAVNNVRLSELRATAMNGAFVQAMRALSPVQSGSIIRYGTDLQDRWCYENPGPLPPYTRTRIPNYTSPDGVVVETSCTQAPRSGINSAGLASFVLVGSSGTPGIGAGLALHGSSLACADSLSVSASAIEGADARLVVQGGIINTAGIWAPESGAADGVACQRFALQQAVGQVKPRIVVPLGGCPPSWMYYSLNAGTPVSWQGKKFVAADKSLGNCIEDANVNSSTSDVSNYLDYVASTLESVTGTAGFVGATGTPSWASATVRAATGPSETDIRYWEISPGVIDEALIAQLTTLTSVTSGAFIKVIVFKPGTYRFKTSALAEWEIKAADAVVVGGTPNWTQIARIGDVSTYCTPGSQGVQFQFQGSPAIAVTGGKLALCAAAGSDKPVVAAPSADLQTRGLTTFSYSEGSSTALCGGVCPLFSSQGTGQPGMAFNGLYFAPGAFMDAKAGGGSKVSFNQGAVLKALSINMNGSVAGSSSVLPPPPSVGDRVVQLKFRSVSGGNVELGYLGTVQVVIRDYFGRRVATGYRILSWRAAW